LRQVCFNSRYSVLQLRQMAPQSNSSTGQSASQNTQ
jgi:hypothetical protein